MTRRRDVYARKQMNAMRRWFLAFSAMGWPWAPVPLTPRDFTRRSGWRKVRAARARRHGWELE